jgi:hypothetical protein
LVRRVINNSAVDDGCGGSPAIHVNGVYHAKILQQCCKVVEIDSEEKKQKYHGLNNNFED